MPASILLVGFMQLQMAPGIRAIFLLGAHYETPVREIYRRDSCTFVSLPGISSTSCKIRQPVSLVSHQSFQPVNEHVFIHDDAAAQGSVQRDQQQSPELRLRVAQEPPELA